MSTPTTATTPDRHTEPLSAAGPPPAVLAGISLGLLIAGLALAAALGGTIPSPYGDPAGILGYLPRSG